MYTAGVWLIYAGVVLRSLVSYAGRSQRDLVVVLLAFYGLFLLVTSWYLPRELQPFPWGVKSGIDREQSRAQKLSHVWFPVGYLFVQSALVVRLFYIPPHLDLFAGLFVPLSLQAVLFFGRRLGFLCIALFPLVMFGPLTANAGGLPFALAMSCLAGSVCFLFGSYAHQVQKAEKARRQNQSLLAELQVANHQLRVYAAQLEDLAAEQERSRLARELHDSVTQTVFSMTLTVQSARLLLNKDPGRAADQLERLEDLAANAMGEIHTLVSQLRPTSLAEEGLPAALRRLAVERRTRDGLQVALEVDGDRALPEAVAAGLYRIAQEALTNVVKHSGTLEATIRLHLGGDPGFLEIRDHGIGFDPQAAFGQRGHLGLPGMVEQAREVGWNLSIDSDLDIGTFIRVEESPL